MKYYKLLTQNGWDKDHFKKGDVYPEDFKLNKNTGIVQDLVRIFPKDWKLVYDSETVSIPKIKFLDNEIL